MKNLNKNLSDYSFLTKFTLQVLGLWPYDKEIYAKLINVSWFICNITIAIPVVSF